MRLELSPRQLLGRLLASPRLSLPVCKMGRRRTRIGQARVRVTGAKGQVGSQHRPVLCTCASRCRVRSHECARDTGKHAQPVLPLLHVRGWRGSRRHVTSPLSAEKLCTLRPACQEGAGGGHRREPALRKRRSPCAASSRPARAQGRPEQSPLAELLSRVRWPPSSSPASDTGLPRCPFPSPARRTCDHKVHGDARQRAGGRGAAPRWGPGDSHLYSSFVPSPLVL